MGRDGQGSWDRAWEDATAESEIATLGYEWVAPALSFVARNLVPGRRVLEAGCGPGRFLYWLRRQGYSATGVDCSLAALAKARAYSPDFRLALADVRRLPFPAASFGTCLSLGVIEHFPEGPDDCLAEMWRVLEPGGVLVLAVPHASLLARVEPPLKALYRWLRRLPPPAAADHEPPGRYYRLDELRQALARQSFEPLETMPFGQVYALHSFCGLFRRRGAYHDVTPLGLRLGRLFRRTAPWAMASAIFVAARKRSDEGTDAPRD